MWVGCQKSSTMVNLRLIEYRKIQLLLKKIFVSFYFQYVYRPFETKFFSVLKIPLMAEYLLWNSCNDVFDTV